MKVYQEIVSLSNAIENCIKTGNVEWQEKHTDNLEWIVKQFLPSGSGIDCGTKLVSADDKKIVLSLSYHHMNDNGYYDGWTEHKAIITPSFHGIDIRITGRDRNGIKDYLSDVVWESLNEVCKRQGESGMEYGWYFGDEWHKRITE